MLEAVVDGREEGPVVRSAEGEGGHRPLELPHAQDVLRLERDGVPDADVGLQNPGLLQGTPGG